MPSCSAGPGKRCTHFTLTHVKFRGTACRVTSLLEVIEFSVEGRRPGAGSDHDCEWELAHQRAASPLQFAQQNGPSGLSLGSLKIENGHINSGDPRTLKKFVVNAVPNTQVGDRIEVRCIFRHRPSILNQWCEHSLPIYLTIA